MFTLMDLLAIFVTRMTWQPLILIGSNHPNSFVVNGLRIKNAPISLKASPFHQVSHPFWGQNGLPIFCAYLGELKRKMGKRRCVDCWHSDYFRILKAFQAIYIHINVFSEIQHDQTQKDRLSWKASLPFLWTGRCLDGRTRSKAAPELSFDQADILC